MGGFIVLSDGRAYAAANWAYDATITAIAEILAENDEGKPLADWLLQQTCSQKGPGLGSVDIRELAPQTRQLFLKTIPRAYQRQKDLGASGWHSPEFFSGWLARFSDLVNMVESMDRGEPPSHYNPHMTNTIPPTGEKCGPGW